MKAAGFKNRKLWTPTKKQVALIEERLPKLLKDNPTDDKKVVDLGSYKRQYYGEIVNGKKLIFLNAMCSDYSGWNEKYVLVFGGGSCYFGVYFNPKTSEFLEFMYNSKK